MSNLNEKVSYLEGYLEGLSVDKETKEGKAIMAILDVLEEIADEVEELKDDMEELEDYVEDLDEDLEELENQLDHDEDLDDFEDDFDEDEEDFEYCEVDCPECGEEICFDAAIVDSEDLVEVVCPECEAVVYVNDGNWDDVLKGQEDEDKEEAPCDDPGCCCHDEDK